MATDLTVSGEWILPTADIPSSGPIESISRSNSIGKMESRICYECGHSYRACECKSCLKCGIPFMKYFGTNVIKGRSHCRMCASPVCMTCIMLIKGLSKVCTRCHLKQKEEEINTEKALSAIGAAKFGASSGENSNLSKLKTMEQKTAALFEAAKKGHDHVVVTLINLGCGVNSTDSSLNTPLFYAAEGGFVQCVALLLEKGATIKSVNNVDWTLLHSVAWKGTTDNHVECAELLLEMGVDVLATSNIGETAADVAERCNAKSEMIQILRSAEVEIAMVELKNKASSIIATGTSAKDKRYGRLILSLLKFVSSMNESKVVMKCNKAFNLSTDNILKTHSLDRSTINKHLCDKCGGDAISKSPKCSPVLKRANDIIKPQADVEPIIRSPSSSKKQVKKDKQRIIEMQDENEKLAEEKREWEDRCRKLMSSIASSNKEHQKQVEDLDTELKNLKVERNADILKCEAAYTNKLSKIRQETDTSLRQLEERLEESEEERSDLLHLHKQYKLTWIPDELISECQHKKCRAPFSKTNRKHHCRCCGRVFCGQCSQQKVNLLMLGYTKPVRVCNTCYALVDDVLVDDVGLTDVIEAP